MDAPLNDLVRALRANPEIRAEGDDVPVMTGHFARFNEWTKIDSAYEGRFLERIAPGAFAKTIKDNRSAVKVLFNHGADPTTGDMVLGIPELLEEDDIGARYEVPLFDGVPPLIMSGLRAGAYGASFRFRVIPGKDDWNDTPKRSDINPDGLPERTVREVQLFEFGPVTFPAYANATAGVRSLSMTDEYLRRRGIPVLGTPDVGAAVPEASEPLTHSGRTPAEREALLRSFNL